MATRIRQGKHQITLARALSKLGIASRTQAAEIIRRGEVTVNGKIVRSPDAWVDLRTEKIIAAGKSTHKPAFIYVAFNKPAHVVTTRSDELGRRTVYDILPPDLPRVFPVGRLDKDTSGLLLLTNDTQFGERITNPKSKIPKTYSAELDRPLTPKDQATLQAPMILSDGTALLPASVSVGDDNTCEITIREGKNRQVRRMFEHCGYTVVHLKRIAIGPVQLGDLKEGSVRKLSAAEVKSLKT